MGEPEIKGVAYITGIHEEHNIILYDDFSMYYNPPEQMIPLLKLLRLNPVKFSGQLLGINEYFCTKSKKTLATFLFKGNEYNPYRLKRNKDRGISRTLKQIEKLRELDNCYYVDDGNERIKYKGADYLDRLVLTFPEKYRKMYEQDKPRFEKIMNKCTKDVEKYISRHFGGTIIFLWGNKHPHKTEEPIGVFHPHLHILFLNITKTKYGWKRFSPRIDRKVLVEMWYKILHKRLGYEWEVKYFEKGKGVIYKDMNVKILFDNLREKAKIRHRFKYNSRSPVEDFFNYYAEWEFDEKEVNKENCKYLLTEYKNRRIAYGAAWNIEKYVKEVDELLECPACNGKLIHENTWSIREFRDNGFWEKYDYFILYLRGGKIAIYPIIKPERKSRRIEREDKIGDSPILWRV